MIGGSERMTGPANLFAGERTRTGVLLDVWPSEAERCSGMLTENEILFDR